MSDTLDLAINLLNRASVTPEDAGCQEVMIRRLEPMGFHVERLRFEDVDNFWARRGNTEPLFAFAGHTDVVPAGPLAQWDSDPFKPEIRNGCLYGRGSADMKGSLAAMITACESFVRQFPDHRGSIAFLITSDEEGPAVNGTLKVMEGLEARGEKIDYCLVGEPSSHRKLGDVVKNGRRGSLNGVLRVHGKQGHVAYPQRAKNPIHACAPILAALCAEQWDKGNEHFPATSFQISNLTSGTGAENVIPSELHLRFNFRFSTELDAEAIKERVVRILERGNFRYSLEWRLSGKPFLTERSALIDATGRAIEEVMGFSTTLSTSGGTSDGRFIAPTGTEVLELGPLNATIHQVNECVPVSDLEKLFVVYQRILAKLLA